MDTLYTFGDNITNNKTESAHFSGFMYFATKICIKKYMDSTYLNKFIVFRKYVCKCKKVLNPKYIVVYIYMKNRSKMSYSKFFINKQNTT